MSNYTVLENAFLPGSEHLFQQPDFLRLHVPDDQGLFFQLSDGKEVVASIPFGPIGNGVWRSPLRGTFAGYDAQPALSLEQLSTFHADVEERLKARGAQAVEVLMAPQAHDPAKFAREFYVLKASGFDIAQTDLNYTLAVNEQPITKRINHGNRARLQRCATNGLLARELTLESLGRVYDTLAANRAMKGHSLSMSLSQIEDMARACPDRIRLWGIADGDQLAAAALCLRLTGKLLYVFYWGDVPGYAQMSPVVALAAAIYEWCQREGVSMMDIGTSTIGDTPNFGLIQFKRGLGCEESLKLRMRKTL